MSDHPDMPAWASEMEARLSNQTTELRTAIMGRIDRMQERFEARLDGEVVTGAQALIATKNAKPAIEANHDLVEMVSGMQRLVRRLEARVAILEGGGITPADKPGTRLEGLSRPSPASPGCCTATGRRPNWHPWPARCAAGRMARCHRQPRRS